MILRVSLINSARLFMIWRITWIFVLLSFTRSKAHILKGDVRHEGGVDWYDLNEHESDSLVYTWTEQAISGVMAAIASKNLKYLTQIERQELELCSKKANTLDKHAKCILPGISASKTRSAVANGALTSTRSKQKLIRQLIPVAFDTTGTSVRKNAPVVEANIRPQNSKTHSKPPSFWSDFLHRPELRHGKIKLRKRLHRLRFGSARVLRLRKTNENRRVKVRHSLPPRLPENYVGAFLVDSSRTRRKRFATRSRQHYDLLSAQRRLTPIGGFAKFLMAGLLEKKNKTRTPWQETVQKARLAAERKKHLKGKTPRQWDATPLEDFNFHILENRRFLPNDVDTFFHNLQSDKKLLVAERQKGMRSSTVRRFMGLMRDGLRLSFKIAGKNITNFDDKTLKVMSPRFFSITADDKGGDGDDDDPIDFLSPSVLSLHNNGTGIEKDLSLPNLVAGFTTADQQQWLDLIFEAAGVEEALGQANEALTTQEFQTRKKRSYEERMRSEDGKPLYFTKERAVEVLGAHEGKRIEHHEQLIRSYSAHQMRAMNESGFAVLSPSQLRHLYGPGSPHADPDRLRLFLSMNEFQILARIEKDVEIIAAGKSRRHKRAIVASPLGFTNLLWSPAIASQPIILSPIIFTNVVGSPALLGPIILGPWMFLPLVLSPRILSPAIVNPFAFVPVILSPLILHPAVLCPGIFNPIVLSPLVMTPFILSPQVFTPLILTPMVMSPFILNPNIGTPLILSPFVLNPVIFSPLALFALVLSPNVLSPLVESKLIMAEVVLSPSWLS